MQLNLNSPISQPAEISEAYRSDEVANSYVEVRFTNDLMRLLHDRQLNAVQRVFDEMQPASSLEIAPGPGRITRDLKPKGKLVCLEYNEAMIRCGQSACGSDVVWVQGDAFDLPFEREFDFVYSFRFIRHFRRSERFQLYSQIHSVLKSGGCLVFDAVNGRISRQLREKRPAEYPIYDELYSDLESLVSELHEAGFEVESVVPVQRWFKLQSHVQNLVGPRSQTLNRWIIRALERVSFGSPLEWIVTCRCV